MNRLVTQRCAIAESVYLMLWKLLRRENVFITNLIPSHCLLLLFLFLCGLIPNAFVHYEIGDSQTRIKHGDLGTV
jgi:hypothetical protein